MNVTDATKAALAANGRIKRSGWSSDTIVPNADGTFTLRSSDLSYTYTFTAEDQAATDWQVC